MSMNDLEKFLCPSCGYKFPVSLYNKDGQFDSADEICPACGYQYGYTDINSGHSFKEWRKKWIDNGMQFKHQIANQDSAWDPIKQLKTIGVELDSKNNIVKEPEEPEWHLKWIHTN